MKPEQALNSQIQSYSNWRSEVSDAVASLSTFLKENNVTDLRAHHQFDVVLGTLADDNLSIAFVAEFSRGKSEMINSIFFGDYKQRVLPSGAGRTTMCPTELSYDANKPNCIRFLPIESRDQKRPLHEVKQDESAWQQIDFDADDQESLKTAFAGLTDVKLVSKAYAENLNFEILNNQLDPRRNEYGLPINQYDEVEIPSWRHAVINLQHPLLEQGLVVLDTPGLNAIGAEPELTLNQLSSAHAVVFILAMDSGVTETDLTLWQEHLGGNSPTSLANHSEAQTQSKNQHQLIALNKIDSLWDGIRSNDEIDCEINRQVQQTARTLSISEENIFPVSAQKGLAGKIVNDQSLIDRSGIERLEKAIAEKLVPEKQQIVIDKVQASLSSIISSADSILDNRLNDAEQHIAELKQISNKNTDVIAHIMQKVQSEKSSLEADMHRYLALRSVYSKETGKLINLLGSDRLERLIAVTRHNMVKCASSITLQKTISKFFNKLNHYLDQAIDQANEIAVLSETITRDFENDHGISNFQVRRLRLEKYQHEISRLEHKHANLKATKTLFFREQVSITNRFYESVCIASRKVFSRALNDANSWNNNLMVPMETYVREHHTQLRRRLESVKRIHKASDTVETRLKELKTMQTELQDQHAVFEEHRKSLDNLLKQPLLSLNEEVSAKEEQHQSADILYWDHGKNF